MHYITSKSQLHSELSIRASKRAQIRASVSSFIQSQYGIDDVFARIDAFFEPVRKDRPLAVLARQVASVCAEDISFTIGAESLGLQPITIPFGRDAYTSKNHDKLHRVKMPWISWNEKSEMAIEYEKATRVPGSDIEGMPLDRIPIAFSGDLVSYHSDLREQVTGERPPLDVSLLYTDMLRVARKKPPFVYREKGGGETKASVGAEGILDRDRPPASWYYVLYLSWFIDGTYVLFETYDNPLSEVVHAKSLFEDTVGKIITGTGFSPLVVKVPHLSMDMLYCNKHILSDGKAAMAKLSASALALDTNDTVAFFRKIADQVIAYR
ncbi:MAG TPA: hypothetical protein VGE35_01480 [Candidatus Paceibacterota bacterium]